MSESLDRRIEEPAGGCCEYGLVPAEDSEFTRRSSGVARPEAVEITGGGNGRGRDPIDGQGRRVELLAPPDWPEGTEVLIEPAVPVTERIGIDESEWRDHPAALADRESWIRTIEPLEYTPEEAASMAEFDERMRQYNIEAVRQQMEKGFGG